MNSCNVNYNETLEQVVFIHYNPSDIKVFSSAGVEEYDIERIKSILREFTCDVAFLEKCGNLNFTFFPLDEKSYILLNIKKEDEYKICHVLLKKNDLFNYYPIQYYNCNFFKNFDYKKMICEGIELLSVNNIEVNPKINYNDIVRFLMKSSYSSLNQPRIRIIKRLINSLIQAIDEEKSLLLKDNINSRVYWIAAIQMSVSRELAHSITFSLSTNKIKDSLVKIYGFSENDTSILDLYINYGDRFQIHDLIGGIESKVKYISEFSSFIQIAYSISLDVLNPFKQFLSKTRYINLNKEIDNCYELFKLVDTNLFNIELAQFIHAIEFLDKYSSLEMREELLKMFEIRIFNLDEYIEKEIIERLILFIVRTANFKGKEFYFKKAFRLLFQYINILISTCDYLSIKEIKSYYYSIKSKLGHNRVQLEEYFFCNENLMRLNVFITNDNIRGGEFYLPLIRNIPKNLCNSKYIDDWKSLGNKCEKILGDSFQGFPKLINH